MEISDSDIGALVLGAGKGTRMYSHKPKVLLELLGEPMLGYLYKAIEPVFKDRVWTVIGHKANMVRDTFSQKDESSFIMQEEQLGTGHALQVSHDHLVAAGIKKVVVINGDTPLLRAEHVESFVNQCQQGKADLAFMTLTLDSPKAFGRVVRDDAGNVTSIVEAKDYDSSVYGPESGEVNAGIYYIDVNKISSLVQLLTNDNKNGEYYITDLIKLSVSKGLNVLGIDCGNDPHLLGVNNTKELVEAEELLRNAVVKRWMERGVMIRAADSVRIGPRVVLEPGVEITGPCEMYGECSVASDAVIQSHCVIRDSTIGTGATIKNFSHLEGAVVGEIGQAGPYARLRPGAELEEDARVGNFVEVKKSLLKKGVKCGHLTYLGDAEIGEHTNIGAGTITCNYDGKNKHKTIIGKDCFIGSNSAIVAPVEIGEISLIGAGSVITKNVPEKTIAVGRGKQRNIPRR